jgi:hypothetical protein
MTYHSKKGLHSLYVVLEVPRLLEVMVAPMVVAKELDLKMDMKMGEVVRTGVVVMAVTVVMVTVAVVKVQEAMETESDQPRLHPSDTPECDM